MPSRKRNQGKARKAKAVAGSETEAGWCADEENELNLLFKGISLKKDTLACSHGHPYLPRGHICTKFMVAFETDLKRLISEHGPYLAGQKAFADSLEKVPLEQEHMQCVLDCLLSLGTDYLLEAIVNKKRNHFELSASCAMQLISAEDADHQIRCFGPDLECYVPDPKTTQTVVDLQYGGIREVVRFFSKRLSCSCLKDYYKVLKKAQPKVSACNNCQTIKLRTELLICTGCR